MAKQAVTDQLHAERLKFSVSEKLDVVLSVFVHKSVDSTNSWCLQQTKAGAALPFACFAEEQTSGRGRRGKHWFMSAHNNIAMSLTWPFVLSAQPLHLLPLSVALAIVEVLENMGVKDVQIKWPNDIYVRDKKIAGILIETQPIKAEQKEGGAVAVVIGVGLNYDMSKLDKSIQQALLLTDISSEVVMQRLELKPERAEVASMLLQSIVALCQNFPQVSQCCLEKFRSQYDYCHEKNVEVILDDQQVLSGLAQGVNDDAELLVLIDGRQRVFNSAEVSVKAQ